MCDAEYRITSALKSNIGLNAIAQYVYTKNNLMPQGLGTGNVYANNCEMPIVLEGDVLIYDSNLIAYAFSRYSD